MWYVIDLYCNKCEETQLSITLPGEDLEVVMELGNKTCGICGSTDVVPVFKGRAKRQAY